MKSNLFTVALLLVSSTPSLAAPQPITDIQPREDAAALDARHSNIFGDVSDLWKRKGGGGGGGKGSGSGSSSSSSGSSSGSSSSSGGKGSSSSSSGGSTKQGSGTQPSYGGGKYYGGGATRPYGAGAKSPLGVTPFFLGGAALAIYPGIWLYGAYAYPYGHPYTFHNRTGRRNTTANNTETRRDLGYSVTLIERQDEEGVNQTKPVTCLCAAYAECGCDDSGDTTFLDSLIGDGTYSALNKSLVSVVDYPNGTSEIVLNGTLENGTTVAGGTEDVNGGASRFLEASGYWIMIALVGCTVLLV